MSSCANPHAARLLRGADRVINGDRENDYGTVLDSFERIAAAWAVVLHRKLVPGKGIEPTDVALMLNQLKVARLVNSAAQPDSWLDMAAYAALGYQVALDSSVIQEPDAPPGSGVPGDEAPMTVSLDLPDGRQVPVPAPAPVSLADAQEIASWFSFMGPENLRFSAKLLDLAGVKTLAAADETARVFYCWAVRCRQEGVEASPETLHAAFTNSGSGGV